MTPTGSAQAAFYLTFLCWEHPWRVRSAVAISKLGGRIGPKKTVVHSSSRESQCLPRWSTTDSKAVSISHEKDVFAVHNIVPNGYNIGRQVASVRPLLLAGNNRDEIFNGAEGKFLKVYTTIVSNTPSMLNK